MKLGWGSSRVSLLGGIGKVGEASGPPGRTQCVFYYCRTYYRDTDVRVGGMSSPITVTPRRRHTQCVLIVYF
jgi:hypothetical protein